jgi:hypothetical protein
MTALASVPARRIIRAIGDAAERFADADFPARVRLLDRIVDRTGYSLPVVEYALDTLFSSITIPEIEAVIISELGSVDALDEQRANKCVCIISSRTTIGVAIIPAVFALCAKCDVLVKDREDGLVRAFFEALATELPEMANAARAEVWDGESSSFDLAAFSVVLAFGTNQTLEAIRGKSSYGAHFVGYGTKASFGYIARQALGDESSAKSLAAGAARDLVLYESEGCMSLHVLFVERGGNVEPKAFVELLARAIERAAVEFPPGEREAAVSAKVAHARDVASFRAATGRGAVFSDPHASFLATLDPPSNEAPLFLPRALGVHTVDNPSEAIAYLTQHGVAIEATAVAPFDAALTDALAVSGTHRFAAFGELQQPPIGGNHGGLPRIANFV